MKQRQRAEAQIRRTACPGASHLKNGASPSRFRAAAKRPRITLDRIDASARTALPLAFARASGRPPDFRQ
ncbi:hypothetical protein [Burkholderia sp. Bp8963]|uniref:hypothetical protein n=1 Tax=Burkholderia sp. Bp8963 TaxID=2184547 RepID=UPI00163A6C6E|nr:hypothetical protein [Burkholderia sp. Bp8963]